MVGSAKGRSTIEFTTDLPKKSSRTSTQASRVPKTAFTATTSSDIASVSLSAATASGALTEPQKSSQPAPVDFQNTAASGSSTRMLRYATAVPAARPRRTALAGRDSRRASTASGSRVDSDRLFDLGDDAGLVVEELVLHRGPAAEVGDREQVLRSLEVVVRRRHSVDRRPVAVVGEDLLAVLADEEVEEVLRGRLLGILRNRTDGLDRDGLGRDQVVDVLTRVLGQDGLVLVAQEHVSLAAGEGGKRVSGAVVLHGDVFVQVIEELGGLLGALALLDLRPVGRHHVPACAAGGEGVGVDHVDARLQQVLPRVDALGIALADDEHGDRLGNDALGGAVLPVRRDEACVDLAGDVRLQGEVDEVRVLTRLDRAALVARRAVRLAEGHVLACVRVLERLDDVGIGLGGRGICDQVELRRPSAAGSAGTAASTACGWDKGHSEKDEAQNFRNSQVFPFVD